MTLAKNSRGEVLVHNGVALEERAMAAIEAFGKPTYLVVPNSFHRQDAKIFKKRYPDLVVLAPKAARKAVSKVIPVDGSFEDYPSDSIVQPSALRGFGDNEGVIVVEEENRRSLVFNDALLNMRPTSGFMGFFLAPTGIVAVPRMGRVFWMKKKGEFREHLLELSSRVDTLVFGHGVTLESGAEAALRAAAERL